MSSESSEPRASALLVAIGQYDDAAYAPLTKATAAARALAAVLERGGYQHAHPELLEGGNNSVVGDTLDQWFRSAHDNDTVVLYWTGHGKSDKDGHYLATKNSPGTNLTPGSAIEASTLGSIVAKSKAEKVLILLDTCYSDAGAGDIAGTLFKILATRPPVAGRNRAFAIVASAHALRKAQEARFCKALHQVLDDPDATKRSWTDNDRLLRPEQLAEAVAQLGEAPEFTCHGLGQQFLPNPRYRGHFLTRTWRHSDGA